MGKVWFKAVTTVLFGLSFVAAAHAGQPQSNGSVIEFTDTYGALFYYKASKEPFDIAAAAAKTQSVQSASPIDRAKVQAAEEERLRKGLETVSTDQAQTVNVSVAISPYDPEKKEFSIDLFEPDHFLPIYIYGQQFHLVFENGEFYRAIKLDGDAARKINSTSFGVTATAKVDFHLTGAGDPTGMTVSTNTIRAAVTRVRLFDRGKQILPDIVADKAEPTAVTVLDKAPKDWTVQGLHLGMATQEFTAAAKTAYGSSPNFQFGGYDRCGGPGRLFVKGDKAIPGTVCITFTADKSGVIKQFSVQQIVDNSKDAFNNMRKLLIDKFGAVKFRDDMGFGWGELVGKQASSNYTVSANLYSAQTESDWSYGGKGIPALTITITDPDLARSKLPAQPISGTGATTAPKL